MQQQDRYEKYLNKSKHETAFALLHFSRIMPTVAKGSPTFNMDEAVQSLLAFSHLKVRLACTGDIIDWGTSPKGSMVSEVLSLNACTMITLIRANQKSEEKMPAINQLSFVFKTLMSSWFLKSNPQMVHMNAWALKRFMTMSRELRSRKHMPRVCWLHIFFENMLIVVEFSF
jgi:hypothetical protein